MQFSVCSLQWKLISSEPQWLGSGKKTEFLFLMSLFESAQQVAWLKNTAVMDRNPSGTYVNEFVFLFFAETLSFLCMYVEQQHQHAFLPHEENTSGGENTDCVTHCVLHCAKEIKTLFLTACCYRIRTKRRSWGQTSHLSSSCLPAQAASARGKSVPWLAVHIRILMWALRWFAPVKWGMWISEKNQKLQLTS